MYIIEEYLVEYFKYRVSGQYTDSRLNIISALEYSIHGNKYESLYLRQFVLTFEQNPFYYQSLFDSNKKEGLRMISGSGYMFLS